MYVTLNTINNEVQSQVSTCTMELGEPQLNMIFRVIYNLDLQTAILLFITK